MNDKCDAVFDEFISLMKKTKECYSQYSARHFWELFDITNDEYHLYSHLLSIYNRDIHLLVCKLLVNLFKQHGIEVSWLFDVYSTDSFDVNKLTTKFIIEKNGIRSGYGFGYTLDGERVLQDIDAHKLNQYIVLLLRNKAEYEYSKQKKIPLPQSSDERVSLVYLEDFWIECFGENEYSRFQKKLNEYKNTIKLILGYQTTPFLSVRNLSSLKAKIADNIHGIDLSNVHYKIINYDNPKTEGYRLLESYDFRNDELLTISTNYLSKQTYKCLLGKADFAISFITSEWMYYSLKDADNCDYTSIVCGYLKSMEQLLQMLVCSLMDQKYDNQFYLFTLNRDKTEEYEKVTGLKPIKKYGYYYIPLLSINSKWLDYSMANLIAFFKRYKGLFALKTDSHRTLCKMLSCFRIECRNGYFHKDNIYDWGIVEAMRNNTYILYYLLLGSYKHLNNNMLGIVESDPFDDLCLKIQKYRKKCIYFSLLVDGEWILTIYDSDHNVPSYDDYGNPSYSVLGFIKVKDYSVKALIEVEGHPDEQEIILISRDYVPEQITWRFWEDGDPVRIL